MTRIIKANTATATHRRVYFDLRDATDGITPETGEAAGQPQVSTDGGTWTNTGIGTLTHVGNGRYYADLTQTLIATTGLVIETRFKSANTAETPGDTFQTVAYDLNDATRLGLSSLPNAAAEASGGLYTRGTGAGQINQSANGVADANVQAISGDTAAADNLKSTYDGTGYADGNAPATQDQIGNIASGAGGISTVAVSRTLTTGTEVNAVTDTTSLNGTAHEITAVGGNTEIYYEFNVTGDGIATGVLWDGHGDSNNDTIAVYEWQWGGSVWSQIGTIVCTNATIITEERYVITTAGTGTGDDLGLARVRFLSTTSTKLVTDRILIEYSVISRSPVYPDGSIWVDTNAAPGGDGTSDNPVSTWEAALLLSASINLHRFAIINDSTITLTANSDSMVLDGTLWNLELGGQSIANTSITGADVSGVSSGDNTRFISCRFSTSTLGRTWASGCRIGGTITFISTGGHFFQSCFSSTGAVPILNLDAVGSQTICLTPLTGGVDIRGTGAGDLVHIEGAGEILIDSSCNGGELEYAGAWRVTDNSTSITLSPDDNTVNVAAILVDTDATIPAQISGLNDISESQVNSQCDLALSDYDGPTNAGMVAEFTEIKGAGFSVTDTLEALRNRGDAAWVTATGFSTFDPGIDTVANVTLVATTTTNTDMRGTDSANAIAPNNADIAAIKNKTDQFVFTVANEVDANAVSGGSDATASNQTSIITHLQDVKGTGFIKDTHSLTDIIEDVSSIPKNVIEYDIAGSDGTAPQNSLYTMHQAAFHSDTTSNIGSLTIFATNDLTQKFTFQITTETNPVGINKVSS